MPIIALFTPKGGAGKSTAALVLATQISRFASVTLIDADPNHAITRWAKGSNVPSSLTVLSDVDEDSILQTIRIASTKSAFVIVDLEGIASKLVLIAISQADLAIVPTKASQLDAEEASRAIRVILQQENMERRKRPDYRLPYSVLLTQTNPAIRTRTLAHVTKGLSNAGIPVFQTELNEREAFKAMFSFRQPLEHLSPSEVPNLNNAMKNAELFASEVISMLRDARHVKSMEVV